jgi:predicted enzyme related to lactoylglutathione lyase
MSATTDQIITGVDFIGISTHDLQRSVEFYGETLELPRSVYIPERNFAEFETGNLTLSIIDADKMGIGHQTLRTPVALRVDDVGKARAALEAKGVTFSADTLDTGVCHMAFFKDPDGNGLMLHHRYAPRVTDLDAGD